MNDNALDFRPSVLKERLRIIKSNPKTYVHFVLSVYKIIFLALGGLLFYQFFKVILGFNAGTGPTTMIFRLITFIVMVWVLYSLYSKGYLPVKYRVEHYNKVNNILPKAKQVPNKDIHIDTDKIIDDVLKDYDMKNERRNI